MKRHPVSPGELAASLVAAHHATTASSLFMLHGIYGRGRNWGVIARQLAERRPDWQSVLVDLRGHGESSDGSGPPTLSSVAADLPKLAATRGWQMDALLGHSFGGKVALACAAAPPAALRQVWLVDSTPAAGKPDGSAWRMLSVVRNHPGPFRSRDEAVRVIEDAGFAHGVAAWMASNVSFQQDAFRWRLDFDLMESLLQDFFRQDYWSLLDDPPSDLSIHVVKATESSLLDESACVRIEEAGRRSGRVYLHRVRGGHWLHTDNPDAVTTLLVEGLPSQPRASH